MRIYPSRPGSTELVSASNSKRPFATRKPYAPIRKQTTTRVHKRTHKTKESSLFRPCPWNLAKKLETILECVHSYALSYTAFHLSLLRSNLVKKKKLVFHPWSFLSFRFERRNRKIIRNANNFIERKKRDRKIEYRENRWNLAVRESGCSGKERQVKVDEWETKGVGTDVPDLERTFGFRCSCNEPWPRRQKPQGRLGPKWSRRKGRCWLPVPWKRPVMSFPRVQPLFRYVPPPASSRNVKDIFVIPLSLSFSNYPRPV